MVASEVPDTVRIDSELWRFRWAEHACLAAIPTTLGIDPRAWLRGFEPERLEHGEGHPVVKLRPDDPDPPSTLEHAVVRHLLSQDRERTHLHAAAVELPDGGAIVVLGPSGSGKSTLARAWSEMGLRVFGDDVVVLDESGLRPFPRLLKVAGQAGDRLIDPSDGGGWGRPGTPVRRILRLDWEEGRADVDVTPCAPTEALGVLMASLHATGAKPEASLDRLLRLARTTPVETGVRGDAERAARGLVARTRVARRD